MGRGICDDGRDKREDMQRGQEVCEERSMEHSDVESAEERQDWVEEVLRRWALKRAIENGSQFARDIGVGQASVSRFRSSKGRVFSRSLRRAVESYWRENGIAVNVAEAELLEDVEDVEARGRQDEGTPSPSIGEGEDEGEGLLTDGVAADVAREASQVSVPTGDGMEGATGVGDSAPDADVDADTDADVDVMVYGEDGESADVDGGASADGGAEVGAPSRAGACDAGEHADDADDAPCDDAADGDLPIGTGVGDSDVTGDDSAAQARDTDGDAVVDADGGEVGGAGEVDAPVDTDVDADAEADVDAGVDKCEHAEASAGRESEAEAPSELDEAADEDAWPGDDGSQAHEGDTPGADECGAGDPDVVTEGERGTDGGVVRESDEEVVGDDAPFPPEETSDLATRAPNTRVPILALLSPEAADAGQAAVDRGWRWHQDPAPEGVHGDALLYLHTLEEVSFADAGAQVVALAPDRHEFACGLTAAEMRFGVHPRQRQKRYAVAKHRDRTLLIGERLAAVMPEVPYEDEDWFFGSEGVTASDGSWLPSAAELVARRRLLRVMLDDFMLTRDGTDNRQLPLRVRVALREVEIALLGVDYGLTFGEQVSGQRTWAPSTRLGIETEWRLSEIETAERRLKGSLTARVAGWSAAGVVSPFTLMRSFVRDVAWLLLKRRGMWDGIFDAPMCRAARVVRSGQLPSCSAVRHYRMLRSLAGVSPLTGQFTGSRDWTAAAPPWSEAHQMKYRPHHITEGESMRWRPFEFDDAGMPLPAARRAELAEEMDRVTEERREKERKRQERYERLLRLLSRVSRPLRWVAGSVSRVLPGKRGR